MKHMMHQQHRQMLRKCSGIHFAITNISTCNYSSNNAKTDIYW